MTNSTNDPSHISDNELSQQSGGIEENKQLNDVKSTYYANLLLLISLSVYWIVHLIVDAVYTHDAVGQYYILIAIIFITVPVTLIIGAAALIYGIRLLRSSSNSLRYKAIGLATALLGFGSVFYWPLLFSPLLFLQ